MHFDSRIRRYPTNRRQGNHKHVKKTNNCGKPRGKGSDYEPEYVRAILSGDKVRIKMCLNKATYHTRAEAEITVHRRSLQTGLYLRSYQCPYCGEYHITKSPERKPDEAA